jgi:hypothetical protein
VIEGDLPTPRGKPTARTLVALKAYDQLLVAQETSALTCSDQAIRRRRRRQAMLLMLLEELTAPELAHYYAGATARRNVFTLEPA